jgi:hypothetical protein
VRPKKDFELAADEVLRAQEEIRAKLRRAAS